ncbi:MAG: orotidine-5'-phosphate decarboxylase [Candidatus Delongbacteria bacterium]|nr:orotidine-5'-phosphate decarboxylase [Candidatus Delongbacteria bacterium]
MSFVEKLSQRCRKTSAYLCVGLDLEFDKLPPSIRKSTTPFYDYNRLVIDATSDLVCAYKPNLAFYEAQGPSGIAQLKQSLAYIPSEIPVILDAKRGDIGNTARMYAQACYGYFNADAVTLSPYLGQDSLQPFLEWKDRFVFALVRTSNAGSDPIQRSILQTGEPLYERVAALCSDWGDSEHLGFVVGATQQPELIRLRESFPERIFLIPGVGSQGGDSAGTLLHGPDRHRNLAVINVSRKIIFPDDGQTIRSAAEHYHRVLSIP